MDYYNDYSNTYSNTYSNLDDFYNVYDEQPANTVSKCGESIIGKHPSQVEINDYIDYSMDNPPTCSKTPKNDPSLTTPNMKDINLDKGARKEWFEGGSGKSNFAIKSNFENVTNLLDDPLVRLLLFIFIIYMIYSIIGLKKELEYTKQLIMMIALSKGTPIQL